MLSKAKKKKIYITASVRGKYKIQNMSRCRIFVPTGTADVFFFSSLVSLSASEVNLVYGPPGAGIRSHRQMYGAFHGEPVRLTDFR